MAVLVEAISVIVKAESIVNKYHGSWEQFQNDVPNHTLCADGELVRIGFMSPHDAQCYVDFLESKGLIFQNRGTCMDIAIVDQQGGFTIPCDWAEFGRVFIDRVQTQKVSACRIKGSKQRIVSYPDGWEYESSLSKDHLFVQSENMQKELEFIRKEGNVSVYRHLPTGKIIYSGSPTIESLTDEKSSSALDEIIVCNLLAHAYNTLNSEILQKIIAEDLLYTSQWVFDEMRGKQAFLDYLSVKFQTIKKAGSSVFAELAIYRGQYCLVIAQGSKANLVATMLVKTDSGKITEIHMCLVPHFSECEQLGIYP
ncbi:MAG: hypothetical protein PHC50_10225 [Candidatus Cloacimonetes bacterium]|nr:hypothetical protein [Candidatus Cloacimonadota bacterium]